jgi:small subunit ribosomal protein S20
MANHSSAKKAIRQTEKRNIINNSRKSRIKTFIKKVLSAISSGVLEDAKNSFIEAQSEIFKGVKARVIKKNCAARKVSSLAKKVKNMSL